MFNKFQFQVLLITTLLVGLLAGFFYTWSFTIMQSLNLISDGNASNAMVSINANIRNGWFAAIFFGAPISIFISLIISLITKRKIVTLWLSIALIFSVATLIITFTKHLPLNAELANGANWSSYFNSWVQWNHVRMATSLLAFISMLFALTVYFKQEREY